jgi:2-haloacid dehalogenase
MRALIFDVFGTCVDWRTSIQRLGRRFGLPDEFADDWRAQYQPQMETVRSGGRPWVNLDILHRIGLDLVLADYSLDLPDRFRETLVKGWHALDPWPDTVSALTVMKAARVIAPCSNGHIALSVNLARHAKLPWDAILGAELAHAYKPDPSVYRQSAYALGLEPHEVCMVAAHNSDLQATQKLGFMTAFVARPTEHGAGQTTDLEPEGEYDYAVTNLAELAPQLI